MIKRTVELNNEQKDGRITVIYGPRRVGKTTLVNEYLNGLSDKTAILRTTSDDIRIRNLLESQDLKQLNDFAQNYRIIFIDEAQRVKNIGLALKMLIDYDQTRKIIVTGSASFDLANKIGEPLTGRQNPITLLPISISELNKTDSNYELNEKLEDFLLYGMYPEIRTATNPNDKKFILDELVNGYLLRDALELEKVKSPKLLLDLLKLLAYQIGKEVSHNELAQSLKIDQKTVSRYLDILEKCFIIYNLRGFSRNLRSEITKTSRYYFYDVGIRNALISNYNSINIRNDIGELFENFVIIERLKHRTYGRIYANSYFWRTWEQQEIDLVEEKDGKLSAFEIKWKNKKVKVPTQWNSNYDDISTFTVVNRDNYLDFINS